MKFDWDASFDKYLIVFNECLIFLCITCIQKCLKFFSLNLQNRSSIGLMYAFWILIVLYQIIFLFI